MRKYLVEFIGTFFIVLTVIVSMTGKAGGTVAIAVGGMLMAMMYAGKHISGAHYNPAITLAACIRGACAYAELPKYWVAQIMGGVLGAFTGKYLIGTLSKAYAVGFPSTAPIFQFVPGMLVEFLGTFALTWVFLQTMTTKKLEGNSYYGIAVGFTLMACIYGMNGISGGAFSPAVATGMIVSGLSALNNILPFFIGQLVAAALAAYAYRYVNRVQKTQQK